jgi:electron transfer flavoprotein beta subunit
VKILVPVKRVIDANFRVRVKDDGSGVDTASAKMSINPFDQIAIEQALRLKEAGVADEVVLVTVGTSVCQDVLRTGLAMGADRAILVMLDQRLEPLIVAKLLASIAQIEKPSLIVMGKQAIDDDANQTGQMLAGLLDWPQATFASSLEIVDGRAKVQREVDSGSQTVTMALPAVVTVDLRLNEPRYASLPNIMKAKSKPITTLAAETLGVDTRHRMTIVRTVAPPARGRGKIVQSAGELAEILKTKLAAS